jgi:hypothetical protein
MAGPYLNPVEQLFVHQNSSILDGLTDDLIGAYSRQRSSFRDPSSLSLIDSFIARIRHLANFTDDVEDDLRDYALQAFDFNELGWDCPAYYFDGEEIPIFLSASEAFQYSGRADNLQTAPGALISRIDPMRSLKIVGNFITKFLAFRSGSSAPSSTMYTAPNITVSNNASGWQIVSSPYYMSRTNGFGGPSTPVVGFLAPGLYRFGIMQAGPAQWHPPSWSIPANSTAYIPLP